MNMNMNNNNNNNNSNDCALPDSASACLTC